MANRRSLHKSISYSEQVDSLSERAQLLFTWLIPHLDDFGRISGSPAKVGAMVVPLKLNRPGWSIDEIEGYLCEMEGARDEAGVPLLVRYVVDGKRVARMPRFEEHQDGLHKRTKSKWPDPPEDILKGSFPEVPGSSGKCTEIPHEEKRREEKGREENTTHTLQGLLAQLAHLQVEDDAREAHDKVTSFLEAKGFSCTREYLVPDRGDGRRGKIDIYAERDDFNLAIEIDRDSPRDKSIIKLHQVDEAFRVILLRNGSCDGTPEGIDAVVSLPIIETPKPSKVKYAEYVSMTPEQHRKLVDQFGELLTARMITVLDNYKGANGKRYKDDYRAILNWVVKRVTEEDRARAPTSDRKTPRAFASLEAYVNGDVDT